MDQELPRNRSLLHVVVLGFINLAKRYYVHVAGRLVLSYSSKIHVCVDSI